MKQKLFSIAARAITPAANGEATAPGTAAICHNLREVDGALQVVGTPERLGTVGDGERILVVDQGRVLLTTGHDVRFAGSVLLSGDDNVLSAHVVGDFVVIITSGDTRYLRYNAGAYTALNPADAMPRLRLHTARLATHTVNIPAITFNRGYERWQAPLDSVDVDAISAAVARAWRDTLGAATREGRYVAPILARYAVRLWDDSLLYASAPVMMGHELIADDRMAVAEVDVSDSLFTGSQPASVAARSFGIGVDVLQGIPSSWHGIVKCIDIYATSAATLVNTAGNAGYRCATSTSAGSRRYLLDMTPALYSPAAMLRQLTAARWTLVASCSNLEALNNGEFNADVALTARSVDVSFFANATRAAASITQGGTALAYNGRLYSAPAARRLVCRWAPDELADTATAAPTTIRRQIALVTSDGNATLTDDCPANLCPTALNPLIAVPDVRATAVTFAAAGRAFTAALQPWHDAAMAIYFNPDLCPNTLAAAQEPQMLNVGTTVAATGQLDIYALACPLAVERHDTVAGSDIIAIGAAARPVYSGGFGRYPVYLFTSMGIYALPQATTGATREMRLIDTAIINSSVPPAVGRQCAWFVDTHATLCAIAGSTVKRVVPLSQLLRCKMENVRCKMSQPLSQSLLESLYPQPVSQLAWNDRFNELWLLAPDGNVTVMQADTLRLHTRSLTLGSLYSDPAACLAIDSSRSLLNLAHECPTALAFRYLSQPMANNFGPSGRITAIEWRLFGNDLTATLALRADNGSSCHGAVVNSLTVNGIVSVPIFARLLSRIMRTLRLDAAGTAPTGTLLRPTLLHLQLT
ncbi:MAG: hypothetical protein IJ835_07575 [Muribaculaceae bacterium]|nr:hypothetical protein [Muribaculaceae bacterium]